MQDSWKNFRNTHEANVDPITTDQGSPDEFIRDHPEEYETKVDAARARDKRWSAAAGPVMKSNFGRSSYSLDLATRELKPSEYLRRAKERSEEHTSELQSLMRISYAVFCLKKKYETRIYNQQ